MPSLVEQLIQTHGSQIAEQISARLGIPADKAAGVLPAVAPMIFGGIPRQTQEPGGEEQVKSMLEEGGDASVLDDIGGFFSNPQGEAQGLTGGLGNLLGGGGQIAQAGGGSALASLLDRDGDGQILDDVAGMLGVGGTLGSLLGAEEKGQVAGNPASGAGDLLGKALGGLLGGKS